MDYKSRGLEFGKMKSKAVGGGVDNAKEEASEPKGLNEKSEHEHKGRGKGKKIHHITIHHTMEHKKGPGFIVTHHHVDHDAESHHVPAETPGDLDGLHAHLEEHMGSPNEGESALPPETLQGKQAMGGLQGV